MYLLCLQVQDLRDISKKSRCNAMVQPRVTFFLGSPYAFVNSHNAFQRPCDLVIHAFLLKQDQASMPPVGCSQDAIPPDYPGSTSGVLEQAPVRGQQALADVSHSLMTEMASTNAQSCIV